MRVAVIDIGTNSTRLLVAEVGDEALVELDRRTVVTRLGEDLEATGRLADAAMERVETTVADYRGVIDALGATTIVAVATSAMRDAANGAAFRELLASRYGVEARTISGDEEARLSFLGATAGRAASQGDTLVIDIGGGSTEFVVGAPGSEPGFHVSTRMGSVRHSERHLLTDPPTSDELAALARDARAIVERDVPADVRRRVQAGIAVAGTATSLAAIDQELEPYDPQRVHGYRLSGAACERMLAMLAALPLAERRAVTGLDPDRAPTIVAGVGILLQAMAAFDLEEVEISEADILHGAALAAAAGD